MKHHPDRNPDDKARRRNSRKRRRRTKSCRTRSKRAAYDQVRPRRRRSRPPGSARRAARRRRIRRLCRRVRRHLRRDLRAAGPAAARGDGVVSRRRPALQPRPVAGGCGARQRGQDPHSGNGGVRDVPRKRAPKPGTQPQATCPTCHGRGEVRVSQGFFSIQQTCPTVPRHRQGHSRSVRNVPAARVASRSTRRCR